MLLNKSRRDFHLDMLAVFSVVLQHNFVSLYKITKQNNGTTSAHLKHITHILLLYYPLINTQPKQKRTIRQAIRKPRLLPLNIFFAVLTELNNYLHLFLGLSDAEKILPHELKDILLHDIPDSWSKQSYLQRCYIEGKTYTET